MYALTTYNPITGEVKTVEFLLLAEVMAAFGAFVAKAHVAGATATLEDRHDEIIAEFTFSG